MNAVYFLAILTFGLALAQQDYVYIINTYSKLALDASEYHIKLQKLTGKPAQLWKLEATPIGTFFIYNTFVGNVLDVEGSSLEGHEALITTHNYGQQRQQWYITPSGRITNAAQNLSVEVSDKKYGIGSSLQVENSSYTNAQYFTLKLADE